MSSNGSILYDEDGDTPDWIELYNPGTVGIDLGGYGITDNPTEPYKWVFPSIEIQPQNHLLIYASGKDRQEWVAHWETIINWGDIGTISLETIRLQIIGISKVSMTMSGQMAPAVLVMVMVMTLRILVQLFLFM